MDGASAECYCAAGEQEEHWHERGMCGGVVTKRRRRRALQSVGQYWMGGVRFLWWAHRSGAERISGKHPYLLNLQYLCT